MNKSVDISELNINDTYFHFTSRKNMRSILTEGLKARVGAASKMVGDEEARVYLSHGGKGVLKIKDTFMHKFKNLRICDIPLEYREYFEFTDFLTTTQVTEEEIYSAMEKKLKDEIYLKVDAIPEEDFLEEDINSLWGIEHDIKGKPNHDIDVGKISLITSKKGNSAFDIIEYIYDRLIQLNPGKEELIKDMFPDLSGMIEYVKQRDGAKERKSLIKSLIEKLENSLGRKNFGHVDLSTMTSEQREKAFIEFGEGNEQLTRLLKVAYEHYVESMFCCSGHGKTSGYVVFKVNDENLEYLQDVGKVLSNQGVVTNFEEHYRLGKRVTFSAKGSQPLPWFGIAADVMENVKNFDSTNPSLYYHEKMYQSTIPLDYRIKKYILDLLRKIEPTPKLLPEPKNISARENRKRFTDKLYVNITNEKSENTLDGDISISHTKGKDWR